MLHISFFQLSARNLSLLWGLRSLLFIGAYVKSYPKRMSQAHNDNMSISILKNKTH